MSRAARTPAALALLAVRRSLRRQAAEERAALPFAALGGGPKPQALAARPKDLRPPELETGRALLAGRMTLAGAVLPMGPGGDPWDTPSPTRRFAVELHRFAWLPALLAQGEPGEREALRLMLDWLTLFGSPGGFAWSAEVLERRLFNWACALNAVLPRAADTEGGRLLAALLTQARWLSTLDEGPLRAAERAAVVATAAGALDPRAGGKLLAQALERLAPALEDAVLADGGHRSRSPQAGLELLFDLLTLDDVLQQRGRAAPVPLSRALDRLTSAARFFTLGDGALAAFQGGEPVEPARVLAARALETDRGAPPLAFAPHAGFQRLTGQRLQVLVDAGAPAVGDWSLAACAQPLALEVTAGRDRLICNSGWSPDATGPELRLAPAGSTLSLGEASPGVVLSGWRAQALGPRLIGAPDSVEVERHEDDGEHVWIELSHAGWVPAFGHVHERRLYMDASLDELRGEDRLIPEPGRGKAVPYALHFHLHPDVKASLALDGRSGVLRVLGAYGGWRLRHDAGGASLEPTTLYAGGLPRRSTQLVLRGQVLAGVGARVRWKLSPIEAEG
jgi:uncharacterized heparinase superfamily protein